MNKHKNALCELKAYTAPAFVHRGLAYSIWNVYKRPVVALFEDKLRCRSWGSRTVNIYLHIYLFLSEWILRAPEGAIDPAFLKEHDPLISCGVGGRGRGGDRWPLPLLLLLHQGHVARRRTPARRPSWDHLRLRPRRDLLQGSRDAGAGGGRGVRTSRMRTKDVREVSRSEGVDGRRAGNGRAYPCV